MQFLHGVMGLTGIETIEVIKGIIENTKPKLVIAIDSLASRSIDRISKSIQISDTGIVPGGGVALLKTAKAIKEMTETLSGDEKTGANIILRAIEEPIRQIATNAGIDGGVVVNNIMQNIDKKAYGFDALNNEYCDMIEKGIVDPTKVTRSALQNACSVSATMLTTEALVAEVEDKQQQTLNQEEVY